ncbi:MAG: low affinity iron permease family protein [Polyangiaceae bacterium]
MPASHQSTPDHLRDPLRNSGHGHEPAHTEKFRKFSHATADMVGRSQTFTLAVLIIAAWGASGPFFHFSDTWQLVINTGTTIVTFLMVFLIQNTQNRDAQAIHLKLDELIRASAHARNWLVALESRSDEELKSLQAEFDHIRDRIEDVREKRRSARVPRKEP